MCVCLFIQLEDKLYRNNARVSLRAQSPRLVPCTYVNVKKNVKKMLMSVKNVKMLK